MELTLNNLRKCFATASMEGAYFIGIAVVCSNCPKIEVIINPSENFESKLAYYEEAYSNNLVLKSCSDVRIVGFTYGDSFDDIQTDLLD